MNAEILMLVGGLLAFALTVHWVRSRELREKYATGWLLVALLLLVCGLFPDLIKRFAEACRLSYPAAVLFVTLTVVYLYSFMVSVSLTHQHRRNLRLTQTIALLELRLRALEDYLQLRQASLPSGLDDPSNQGLCRGQREE